MNPFAPAASVAKAVLYEGYLLYPYTASAPKNRLRWQFGVLVPQAYLAKGTGEVAEAQTEVLAQSRAGGIVEVRVGFLQVEARCVEAWSGRTFEAVDSIEVDGKRHLTFEEGVEREIDATLELVPGSRSAVPIAFPEREQCEPLRDKDDALCGRIVRRRWPLHGAVTLECEAVEGTPDLRKVRVRIENRSCVAEGARNSALRTAFVSTHTLLHAQNATFLSALDPPESAARATEALANRHTWPVLVGEGSEGAQFASLVLSSPIILYDFPAVAPQSAGDTFDATEVDELMMLSVLGLSDRERAEARATDPLAAEIVERAERFGPEELAKLHGTLLQAKRDPLTALDVPAMDCVFVEGMKVAKGSVVRLHPKRRADVWDVFLEGKLATVRAIHQDVEGQMYVAVTVDDDPASDLHDWYGRSFFFYPDEVEAVAT